MEDSSLKVELAEQEMRRAVGEMKQEQRLNSAAKTSAGTSATSWPRTACTSGPVIVA